MSPSPLFPILTEKMTHWEHNPMFGDYLVAHFNSSKISPVIDAQRTIILGNEYFKSKGPLEQGKAFLLPDVLALIFCQPTGILHWGHMFTGIKHRWLTPLTCMIMHFACLIALDAPQPLVGEPLQA
jgi:hypothetical protein